MIDFSNVCKSFQDGPTQHAVLKQLSIRFPEKTSIAITGESGSGKSTFLHLLAALDAPDSGSIKVDGTDLAQLSTHQTDEYRKRQLGFIFQRFNLIDCLSVRDNICFSARLTNQLDADYLEPLLQQLGIDHILSKMPQTLSGGEQQRVAIARALAHKPRLILADEPTGNLDEKNSKIVADLMFNLSHSLQTTLVVVTHSQSIAHRARHHFHLQDGQLFPKLRSNE